MTWFMNGSLGNIHGLQFLGIARGNLKLGAGLVIMKVLLWNMDNKSQSILAAMNSFKHQIELVPISHTIWNYLLQIMRYGCYYFYSC